MNSEEIADECVKDLRSFIHTEEQKLAKVHDLEKKIWAVVSIFDHLFSIIPKEEKDVRLLVDTINFDVFELKNFIEQNDLVDIGFVQEEKHNLDVLSSDIEHRNWQAAQLFIDKETKKVKKIKRIDGDKIKEFHHEILVILKDMKQLKHLKKELSQMEKQKSKDEYLKKEEYYLVELYKFLRAYEKILRHMWRKENHLARHMKKMDKKL